MKSAYDNGSGALSGLEFLNADFGECGESEEVWAQVKSHVGRANQTSTVSKRANAIGFKIDRLSTITGKERYKFGCSVNFMQNLPQVSLVRNTRFSSFPFVKI
jgi:hypothetical protein